MPIIDSKGRLFAKVSIVDLFLCALAVLAGVCGYVKLTAPARQAPVYSVGEADTWATVDIALPQEQAWMTERATPGASQIDPRTGSVVAKVLQAQRGADGTVMVRARLRVARDSAGRMIFGAVALVPGQRVRMETDTCVIEGTVARIEVDEP